MEFPHLGEHCSLQSCNLLDFLPFTCDACSKIFCKDHLEYGSHQCQKGLAKDRRVPVCPLCNQPISQASHEDANQKVNEHIENDCKSDLAKRNTANRCNARGCKQKELIPVLCASCKRNFCLKHRHENDHACTGKVSNNRQSTSASLRAGQAAASRLSNAPQRKPPPQQRHNPSRPQHTTLSSIGSDLNRERQQRQQVAPARQAAQRALTEDEQLALAIAASLDSNQTTTTTSGQPSSNAEHTPDTQEEMDAALARAPRESEIEERNRQRQQGNSQQQGNSSNKDSCSVM